MLLTKLMGPEAMGAPSANLHFTDPKVCRNFLCGTCPHDLFANTKVDLGPCPKSHTPKYKDEYCTSLRRRSTSLSILFLDLNGRPWVRLVVRQHLAFLLLDFSLFSAALAVRSRVRGFSLFTRVPAFPISAFSFSFKVALSFAIPLRQRGVET